MGSEGLEVGNGPGNSENCRAGYPIEVVTGRGCYGGNRRAGHHRGMRPRCFIPVACSGPPGSDPGPGQQILEGPGLRLLLLNARSVNNKAPLICDLITEEGADLACITETWLGPEGGVPLSEMCPAGFQVWHQPRHQGRGGGVAVVIRESLMAFRGTAPKVAGCEALFFKLGSREQLGVLLLYQPPCCVAASLPDLLEAVSGLAVEFPRLMVLGDFNLPSLGHASGAAREFLATMAAMGLSQIIQDPTRDSGLTPDLVFLSEQCQGDLRGELQLSPLSWSDHALIALRFSHAAPLRREAGPIKLVRPRRLMDPLGFQRELGVIPEDLLHGPVEALVASWNREAAGALDRIAPVRPLLPHSTRNSPWYTEELRSLKRVKRRLERRWRKTRNESDRTQVRAAIKAYLVAVRAAKSQYFSTLIASAECRPTALFKITRSLLGKVGPVTYLQGRANEFSEHLQDKIAQIRSVLDSKHEAESGEIPRGRTYPVIWEQFDPVGPEEVDRILRTVSATTCHLDPCPSWLVKAAREVTCGWVQVIANASLREGVFPAAFKEALVHPLLKKPSLDPTILDNFRPVSHLPYLGKVVEKVVALQLQRILDETDYLDPFQSGFRPRHGTETALVALMDDLWHERDGGSASILALLDLSAAFDTIDHGILLGRLRELGVGGVVLRWFTSFLQGRSQSVVVGGERSDPRPLHCGVPQGSVLSPLLFNIYMKPLGEIIRHHGVRYHQYADDTQLYISVPGEISDAVTVLSRCLEAVGAWMGSNRLRLNPGKTEWLWVNGSPGSGKLSSLVLDGVALPLTDPVRNLGVLLDSQLLLEEQVAVVARRAFAQLRVVRQLRPFLDREALRTVTHALVISHIDYCNALYMGLPLKSIRKLQLAQSAAARVILGAPRSAHITPLLRELHWLPVCFRVQFKVLVITFKALHGMGPGYLRDRLIPTTSSRPTRSYRVGMLQTPSARDFHLAGSRRRAFSAVAPALWNSIPPEVRQAPSLLAFRKSLKTWLCQLAWGNSSSSHSWRWLTS